MKGLNLGFTYNLRHFKPSLNNHKAIEEAEFDEPEAIEGIINAFKQSGHKIFAVEADENAYENFKKLKGEIDLVFNYAEGLHGKDREAHIPAILEMLEIPYTGGRPLSYALGLNKAKTKEILAFHKIPTPKWQVFSSKFHKIFKDIKFPLIIKPNAEGSSKGIYQENLVYNEKGLFKITKKISDNFKQNVLIEEYLEGREFTVAVLGNSPKVLPIIEVSFDDLPKDMPKFDHYEAKWIYDNPNSKSDPLTCPAKIERELKKKIEKIVLDAFEVLYIEDWARFDIRLDNNGVPNILEVNCPPGIIPDPKENSRFPRAARAAGYSFPEMLNEVINSACKRYNISV